MKHIDNEHLPCASCNTPIMCTSGLGSFSSCRLRIKPRTKKEWKEYWKTGKTPKKNIR